MASNSFERCLAITLKWEGGYSNHPDDPGGPTMRGIIQREYNTWRKKNGKRLRPVHQIDEDELQSIYRNDTGMRWAAKSRPQVSTSAFLTPRSIRECAGRTNGSKLSPAETSMPTAMFD